LFTISNCFINAKISITPFLGRVLTTSSLLDLEATCVDFLPQQPPDDFSTGAAGDDDDDVLLSCAIVVDDESKIRSLQKRSAQDLF
jgi:hypothetical protein